jgi:hypothetical protein
MTPRPTVVLVNRNSVQRKRSNQLAKKAEGEER